MKSALVVVLIIEIHFGYAVDDKSLAYRLLRTRPLLPIRKPDGKASESNASAQSPHRGTAPLKPVLGKFRDGQPPFHEFEFLDSYP
jgi:hypothetical protein